MEKEIGFKAINSGLGLDHFSDGLPYTPKAQTVRTQQRATAPTLSTPNFAPVPAKTQPLYNEEEVYTESGPAFSEFPASVLARGAAFLIDIFVASSIFIAVVYAGMRLNSLSASDISHQLFTRSGAPVIGGIVALYCILTFAYFLVQEVGGRTTFGKNIFKLQIVANSSLSVFFRSVCFLLAVFPLGFGLFWGFFDSRRRCWHDVITDSRVVKIQ